jgi:hypothetical protein
MPKKAIPLSFEIARCPCIAQGCEGMFYSVQNAKRHIRQFHPELVNSKAFKGLREKNRRVKRKCTFCKKDYDPCAVSRHQITCKAKKHLENHEAEGEEKAFVHRVDKVDQLGLSFARGAEQVLTQYKQWASKNTMAAQNTVDVYGRKLKQIFEFWEETVPNFVVDKLLYMHESQTTLPYLTPYLPSEKSPATQKIAIQAYLHLIKFLRERVNTMYTGAGAAVPIVERVAILQILTECEDVKQRLLWDHKICKGFKKKN